LYNAEVGDRRKRLRGIKEKLKWGGGLAVYLNGGVGKGLGGVRLWVQGRTREALKKSKQISVDGGEKLRGPTEFEGKA